MGAKMRNTLLPSAS